MRIAPALIAFVLLPAAALAQSGTRVERHTMPEFLQGELDGLSVGPVGEIVPAPVSMERFFTPALYIWCLALDADGRILAGTGDEGSVVRIEDGEAVELAKLEGQLVMDVVEDDGAVYAATGPEGKVYRIREGEVEVVLQRGESTVWTLEASHDGESWLAGVGPEGALVRFEPDDGGEGQVLRTYGASVARLLLRDGERLWLTTQGPALILQSSDDPDVPDRLRHDAGAEEIPAVVPDGDGGLWFLVLSPGNPDQFEPPSSKLMHLPADGSAETLWEGNVALMSLAMARDGALLAGEIGASRVHRITRDGRIGLWRDFGDGDASALLADGDITWVGSSNLGDLFRLAPPEDGRGTFTSPPVATPAVARWGRLWIEGTGDGLRFATRSGMRSEPDDTWSEWSGWKSPGAAVDAPLADYLQYRISLEDAELTAVNVAWARRNHAPRIRGIFFEPDPSTIDWSNPEAGAYNDDSNGNAKSVAWLRRFGNVRVDGGDPDGDPIALTLEVQREGDGPWYPLVVGGEALMREWDTTQFEDGTWRARATLDDGKLQARLVSQPVTIDNGMPRLDDSRRSGSTLRFRVEDSGSRIERVELRREGEEAFRRIEPDDGVTDGEEEEFTIALDDGAVAVWIRVRDVAGNEAVFSPRMDD